MKIHNCVHFIFSCALCAASLSWGDTDTGTRSRRATPSPDGQDSDRPASSALPVVRPTVTTQSPSQASLPEKLDRDQQLLPTPSSASGELEAATRKPRRKGRKRQKTTTPGLDIAPDRGRNPSRPNNDGDVRAATLTSTRLPVINDEGETDEGRREGKAVTPNITDATSGDDIHTENSHGEKTPIYWPWGPQRNGKNNASVSAHNLTAAQSAGLHNESYSGDRGNMYWPWGPNDKLRNVSSSEGNTSGRPDSEGGDASSDLYNPDQGRPQHVPWPWGPGVKNSSRSPNPGGNGSSGSPGLASSHHVHHHVPELDDARLADASVVVAKAEGMYFIQRLFQRYTSKQGTRGRLSASDLAALLENILFKGAAEKAEAAHVHRESSAEPPLYRPQGDLSGGYQGLHEEHSQCLSAQQLLQAFHYETGEGLDYRRFMYLCPALLYQLDSSLCAPHSHGPAGSQEHFDHATNTSHSHALSSDDSAGWKRWLVAVGSVLVISVVGLACVLAVQRVRSSVRHFLLPFLVALAVGALSGDALLHLLPHALAAGHAEEGGDHRAGVWKGLTALTGMLVFWGLENVFRLCQRRRSRKRPAKDLLGITAADLERSKSHMTEMEPREEEVMLQIKPSLADKAIAETDVVVRDGHSRPETDDDHHHHHGHAHEHAHSVPDSMAAILSMVVLGDGIHNLLDGLAIGAAFTAGLTSGLSTALAVLCHELPHEIGDFAMLLSAGMPVRRALLFNCVSSALCVLGCLVGLAVGDTASLTTWLLSAVAGLFLFLALVTMLPQLREERQAESFRGFLLRASGILLGAGIMLVIAVFEEELKTLLEV